MTHAAYIQLPVWARWLQRILFAGFYSLVLATGLRAAQLPSGIFLDLCGWVMVTAAIVCLIGVATRYYNIEMIGLYLACAGLCGGAMWAAAEDAWYAVYTVLAIVCGLGLRLLDLALIAWRARTDHYLTQGS